jgi:hypothetical protein
MSAKKDLKKVHFKSLLIIKKGMSCLFQSLSSFISGMDEKEMRQKICDYLETNPDLIEDLSLQDLLRCDNVDQKDYVRIMRNDYAWGGALEIKAFCEIFMMAVEVRIQSTGKSVLFRPHYHPYFSKICIEWQGCHYVPLPY